MKKIGIIAGILLLEARVVYKIDREEMYYNPYDRKH